MITTTILTIVYGVVYAAISPLLLLPNATLPGEISGAINQAGASLAAVEVVVPVGTILIILSSFITIEAGIFVFKSISWIIKKIPTIN